MNDQLEEGLYSAILRRLVDENMAYLGLATLVAKTGRPLLVQDPGPESPWLHADEVPAPESVLGLGRNRASRYAIWKRTGAVHRVQDGTDPYPEAVEDDPILVPEVPGL